jgi:hypothetical protein
MEMLSVYIIVMISSLQPRPLVFTASRAAGVKASQFIGFWNNKSTAHL